MGSALIGSSDPTKIGSSNCKIANIGYSLICELCAKRNVTKTYEGKTCRNAYIWGQEHKKQLENRSDKSVLFKHIQDEHKDEEDQVNFKMKITGRFKKPMIRQLDGAIRIQRRDPKTLLNSKKEFYGPAIQRKILERKGLPPEK